MDYLIVEYYEKGGAWSTSADQESVCCEREGSVKISAN